MIFGTYACEGLSTRFNNGKFNISKGKTFCRFNVITYLLHYEGSMLPFMLPIRRIDFGERQVIVRAIN